MKNKILDFIFQESSLFFHMYSFNLRVGLFDLGLKIFKELILLLIRKFYSFFLQRFTNLAQIKVLKISPGYSGA